MQIIEEMNNKFRVKKKWKNKLGGQRWNLLVVILLSIRTNLKIEFLVLYVLRAASTNKFQYYHNKHRAG